VDFGIVVEESFWHEEYVTGSTIMIEKIEVEKLAMQSVMQKSARKKQHKFREGNIVKIQNTHQVEMEWVNMVTTKLVEWADKVVNNTLRKAVDMVYMMQMIESFIHQYEEYTRKVDCLRKEVFMVNLENLVAIVEVVGTVFNVMKHNMEEFAVQKGDISMIEDTNTGIVVDFKSVEVAGTVIIVKNIMNEGYMMQNEENVFMIEDNDVGIVVISKFMEVIETVFKMEYNTAGMQKKLTVEEGDINRSVEVVRTAIVEVVRTAIVEVVRTAIVEVVRTAITNGESNKAEIEKNLTVKKSDINMFEDIHMMNGDIVEFIVMVKEVFYNKFEGIHMRKVVIFKFEEVVRMIIDKKEYNTMEMREELVIEENNIMLEDTNMMDRVIFKFEKTVIKMDYRTAEMKKRFTVEKEKSTKKREDFWSFRDIETRQDSVLSWRGKELVEFVARHRLHLGSTAG
jgi:hypothetical protein